MDPYEKRPLTFTKAFWWGAWDKASSTFGQAFTALLTTASGVIIISPSVVELLESYPLWVIALTPFIAAFSSVMKSLKNQEATALPYLSDVAAKELTTAEVGALLTAYNEQTTPVNPFTKGDK